MSITNGANLDNRPGWSEVETSEREAYVSPPVKAEMSLDRIARIVSTARREKAAIDRIVSKYHIADDAGIRTTIISRALDQVKFITS